MKRFLTVLSVLVVSGAFVFAGGSQEPAPEDTGPVTIRIMGYGGQDPAIVVRLLDEVIGSRLEEDGIELVYEPLEGDYNAQLFNALSAGTAGDIVYIPAETAPGIIATGQIMPLDDVVDADPFIDSLVETYTFDGSLYGIAKDFNTLALHYNMDLFDEAGVPYPDENDTWESLAEKLAAVSELGDDIYGLSIPTLYERFGFLPFSNGWQPFDADGTTDFLDPAFVESMEYLVGLYEDGSAVMPQDLGQGWSGGALATERVGVAVEGAWILGFLRNEAPNLQFGTAPLPLSPSGTRGNFLYTVAYGINANTKHPEAAVKVLEALTSVEAQQFILEEGLAIPSRAALADNPFFDADTPEATANRIIFEGASDGNVQGYQFGTVGTDWFQPINAAITSVVTDQGTLQEELRRAQEETEALIERSR
ncbi:MAG: extracellular solute-binding protein [Alkalispirochaeta sp.]